MTFYCAGLLFFALDSFSIGDEEMSVSGVCKEGTWKNVDNHYLGHYTISPVDWSLPHVPVKKDDN